MRLPIFIGFLIVVLTGVAQDLKITNALKKQEDRASAFFKKQDYSQAAALYEEVFENEPNREEIAFQAAECYRLTSNYVKAERWYKNGIDVSEAPEPTYILHYAQALTANEKYEEAKIWFRRYNELVPDDQRAIKKLNTLENLHFHFRDSGAVILEEWSVNTEFDEYAPAYYHGGVAFLSNRSTTQKFKNVMNWGNESNYDLFYTREREDGRMESPVRFHPDVNSSLHEGPFVLVEGSPNDEIIFTQSMVKKGETYLALYEAEVNTRTHDYSKIKPLNINDPSFSNAQPALSPDGNTLFFASSRPGGYGGTDLYRSSKTESGWSDPENLGSVINSKGGEYFPFMMNEDELVFASDGHGGLGGMDLFSVDLSVEPYKIENLGYPLNSSKDDYAYISNSTGTEGYLSSNRKSGQDDDIFKFRVIWSAYELTVTELGESELLPDVEVKVIKGGELRETRYTNSRGFIDLLAIPGEEFILEVKKEGFVESGISLTPTLTDAGKIIPIRIELEREVAEKPARIVDTENLDYAKYFRQEKLVVQVDGKVYEYRELGDQKFLVSGDEKIKLADIDDSGLSFKERALEALKASNISVQNTFDVTTVYFDYNSEEIREEDKKMLDGIVELLKANDNVKVEVHGFTDSFGSMNFNDLLSFARAQKVARYLMERRVQGSRLVVNGYGEQGILNGCTDEVECSDVQHSVNRRVEFKVLIYPEDYQL